VSRDRCFVARGDVPLEQQLGDRVADGRMSSDDADTVRMFGDFLVQWGDPKDRDPEVPTLQRRIAWLEDDEKAAFLGLTEQQRTGLLAAYRARLGPPA
jgi:hypothetical protein